MLDQLNEILKHNQFLSGGLALGTLGAGFAYLKNVPFQIGAFFKEQCTISVTIEDEHVVEWLEKWLKDNLPPKRNTLAKRILVDERPEAIILPGYGQHFAGLFKGVPFWISHKKEETPAGGRNRWDDSPRKRTAYNLTFLTRDLKVPKVFLNSCRDVAIPDDKRIELYIGGPEDYWDYDTKIDSRAEDSVILPEGLLDNLKLDLNNFIDSKDWYKGLGIPYRRGYLLHGTPGSGKSSTVLVLASLLKYNIYILRISEATDSRLFKLMKDVPKKSLILIEDIDAIFRERDAQKKDMHCTFSGLLNALDGVEAVGDRIVFLTTNYKDKLDAALIRPGRVDYQIEFKNASKAQAKQLFERFYKDGTYSQDFCDLIEEGKYSMAELQSILLHFKNEPLKAVKSLKGDL